MNSLVRRILGIAPLVFGLGLSVSGLQKVRDAYASNNWPTTEGKVLHSVVTYNIINWMQHYEQEVQYAYSVDGQRFTSNQIRLGSQRSALPDSPEPSNETLRRFLDDPRRVTQEGLRGGSVVGYPPGKKVTVYYKPDDPQVAVLEPGVTVGTFMPLLGGIIIALVGLLATLGARI